MSEVLGLLNEDKVSGFGEDRRQGGPLSKGSGADPVPLSELGMQEGIRLRWKMMSSEYLELLSF